MAEHEPHRAPFDEPALAEALGSESATTRDVAYGEGVQYSVGRDDARLEIFPRTGVTRLTAQGARVELFGSKVIEVSPGGVEFSRTQPGQDASLTVVPGGGIVFTLVAGGERTPPIQPEPHTTPPSPTPPPLTGPETAQERGDLGTGLHSSPPTEDAPSASQAAQEPAPPSPGDERTTSHQQSAAETEQERISLTGRLGRDPQFRTTKTGSLVGKFPLAVHREDGNTTWHTVLAFGSRAEQLQRRVESGDLTKGREVDVVGYLHVNDRPGKDGKPRKVQEVYAVAVQRR